VRVLGLYTLRFSLLLLRNFRHGRRLPVVHATILRSRHTLVSTLTAFRGSALTGNLRGGAGTL